MNALGELPPDLGPPGGPENFGQESSDQKFAPRNITMEDAIARQLDRIAFLRSTGQDWSEAVYQLRDMVVGLEDQEFWDGIPPDVRRKLKSMSEAERRRVTRTWEVEGWSGYPVRAIRGPNGEPVFMPTSENLSCALRIVMRLLARQGIAWRTRRVSHLVQWGDKKEEGSVTLSPLDDDADGIETGSPELVADEGKDIEDVGPWRERR